MSCTEPPTLVSSKSSETCATEKESAVLLCSEANNLEQSLTEKKCLNENINISVSEFNPFKNVQKTLQNNPHLDKLNSVFLEKNSNDDKIDMECVNYNGDLSETEPGGEASADNGNGPCLGNNASHILEKADNRVQDLPKPKSVNGFSSSCTSVAPTSDTPDDDGKASLGSNHGISESTVDKLPDDHNLSSDAVVTVKSSSSGGDPVCAKEGSLQEDTRVPNKGCSKVEDTPNIQSKPGMSDLKSCKVSDECTKGESVSVTEQPVSKESSISHEGKDLKQVGLASDANSTSTVTTNFADISSQLNTVDSNGVNLSNHQNERCSTKNSTSHLFINVNNTNNDGHGEEISHCKKESVSSTSETEASDKDDNKSLQKDNNQDAFCDSVNSTGTSNVPSEVSFPNCFAGLVTIGKYIPVKGDFTLRSSEALIESPSIVVPFLLKEHDKFPPKLLPDESKAVDKKSFFHSSVGEFLIGIGLSRVNEWYYRDMTRLKARQIRKGGRNIAVEEEMERHRNDYLQAKKANEPFTFSLKKCEICDFTTESLLAMEGHKLTPHITNRREYRCSYCVFITRDPKEMLFHMEALHSKIGRIEPPVQFYECPFCPFENNSKGKLNNHLNKCQRYFDRAANQAPPRDFDYPAITPKPITVAVVKAYEKSINPNHRGRGRPKKNETLPESFHQHYSPMASGLPRTMGPHQNMPLYRQLASSTLSDNLAHHHPLQTCRIPPPIHLPPTPVPIRPRHPVLGQVRPNPPQLHLPPANRIFQVVSSTGQVLPLLGNSHLVTSSSQLPLMPPNVDSSICQKKLQNPQSMTLFANMYGGIVSQSPTTSHGLIKPPGASFHSGLKMAQPPKLQGPYPVQSTKPLTPANSSITLSSLVVCEICDGYIKDLEQLRTHMQLIHKVKIHPKMLASRPPLNCQKCQWRFFTDQGLERHLLGAHGLVTSNMQELANKNQDSGCCTVCGRVYASKLVAHMSQVHKVTLKPAHLSYKCTVCSATFNLYKLFENHVYLVHSGAVKRPSEDSSPVPCKKSAVMDSADERKENENIAENVENATPASEQGKTSVTCTETRYKRCKDCGNITNDMLSHLKRKHIKKCTVKLCRIEKCEKCLCSSDSMVVIRMSDFGLKDDDEEEEETSGDENDLTGNNSENKETVINKNAKDRQDDIGDKGDIQTKLNVKEEHVGIKTESIGDKEKHVEIKTESIRDKEENAGIKTESIGDKEEHVVIKTESIRDKEEDIKVKKEDSKDKKNPENTEDNPKDEESSKDNEEIPEDKKEIPESGGGNTKFKEDSPENSRGNPEDEGLDSEDKEVDAEDKVVSDENEDSSSEESDDKEKDLESKEEDSEGRGEEDSNDVEVKEEN